MANYIDKEIVCEAYVHLDVQEDLTELQIEKIERHLKKFFDDRVRFLLGEEVATEIETAEGSLKVKLTAFAGIAALLGGGVLKYPEFRDAVKAIYDDSRMLAEASNLETVFVTRTPSCDRLHAEARTGVIGKTAKLITALETIKSKTGNINVPVSRADIREIDQLGVAIGRLDAEMRNILEKVKTDEDRFCLAKGIHQAFNQLPEILSAETGLKNTPLSQTILESSNLTIPAESAFQRYTAAVKTAKDYLKRVGVASLPKKA
jgi:hypothetical protein